MEQGREVFAVPGSPLDPRSEGPNSLIRDGAVLVRAAEPFARRAELLIEAELFGLREAWERCQSAG